LKNTPKNIGLRKNKKDSKILRLDLKLNGKTIFSSGIQELPALSPQDG
jgi:hypothetical protein